MTETLPLTEEQCVVYFPIDFSEPDLDLVVWAIERQKAAALMAVRFGCAMQTEWIDKYRDLAIGICPRNLYDFLAALPHDFRPASVNYKPSPMYPDEFYMGIAERVPMDGEIVAA